MTIEYEQYQEARKVLHGGSAPVAAHAKDSGTDDWGQVVELKAIHGGFLARFFSTPDYWTHIDGLDWRHDLGIADATDPADTAEEEEVIAWQAQATHTPSRSLTRTRTRCHKRESLEARK